MPLQGAPIARVPNPGRRFACPGLSTFGLSARSLLRSVMETKTFGFFSLSACPLNCDGPMDVVKFKTTHTTHTTFYNFSHTPTGRQQKQLSVGPMAQWPMERASCGNGKVVYNRKKECRVFWSKSLSWISVEIESENGSKDLSN